MDVLAETSAVILKVPRVVTMTLDVSNPATSSYIRIRNKSAGVLRLDLSMLDGSAPEVLSELVNHNIDQRQEFVVSLHNSRGSGPKSNTWVTNFVIKTGLPARLTARQRKYKITLVNAPGGKNWTAVEVEEIT